MKAIIIDDEKHVRDAIRLLVQWEDYGIDTVLEASDGLTGMELIRFERPEIIFTDMMMPGASGSELLEWVSLHSPASKTVVISGHDDFNFVRNAVKYGGVDYILKPIDPVQLNDALLKAVDLWKAEEQARCQHRERGIEINKLKPVYWDSLFTNLLHEPSSYSLSVDPLQREFGLSREVSRACVAILNLDMINQTVARKFASSRDLLFFSLANVCNEFLRSRRLGYAFRHLNRDNEIVLLLWSNTENADGLLEEVNAGIHMALGSRFTFGIGDAQSFPEGLPASYKEARAALRLRNLLQKQTWVHRFPKEDPASESRLFFADFEENISFSVKGGSPEQLTAAFQPWFESVRNLPSITLEQLEGWWHEYRLAYTQWLAKYGPQDDSPGDELRPWDPDLFIVPLDEKGDFSLEDWNAMLLQLAVNLAKSLSEHRSKDHSVIRDIAKYIEQHVHQEISLQDITNRFFLSREYISRKFKQEMNENISDFIARIRIDKAKLLLTNPHFKMTQIAEMVGFQDEKYFSKVFKKWTGISPNEFRKQRNEEGVNS